MSFMFQGNTGDISGLTFENNPRTTDTTTLSRTKKPTTTQQQRKNSLGRHESYKPNQRKLAFEFDEANAANTDSRNKSVKGNGADPSKAPRTVSQSFRNISAAKQQQNRCTKVFLSLWHSTIFRFRFFVIFIPCFISCWYAAAILFPPGARAQASLLLWDDGQLVIDGDGKPSLCPRASICAEGIAQVIMIALARLTAFASYVFMGITFISKMHFLIHYLSSTYLMRFIPFESLHNVHTSSAKWFGGLIFIHTITHYIRYILRGSDSLDQLGTKVHVSGLIGVLSMILLIVGMSSFVKKRKDRAISKFEIRFNLHWTGFIVLCVAMFVHTWRTRVLTAIFMGLWFLDYLYGVICATYNLPVVELCPLPNQSGLQMLWHNPDGFEPRSGEFVKVQMPWLSKGGDEWHPFSIYLRESTEGGLSSVYNLKNKGNLDQNLEEGQESNPQQSLEDFTLSVLQSEFANETIDTLEGTMNEEAREDIYDQYNTTQVFICPVGDWSKNLMEELEDQKQLRACWVRGPYTSPYFVAQNFSHLMLTATGIGITPALGVMGQYPGFSRTKILVWSTRDKNMLKFFVPLITDAHLAAIYYTGKEKFEQEEVRKIQAKGNIFLQQKRPPNGFHGAAESIIVEFENHINMSAALNIKEIEAMKRAAWCVFYCGGSVRIQDELRDFSKENGLGFESELFDW